VLEAGEGDRLFGAVGLGSWSCEGSSRFRV